MKTLAIAFTTFMILFNFNIASACDCKDGKDGKGSKACTEHHKDCKNCGKGGKACAHGKSCEKGCDCGNEKGHSCHGDAEGSKDKASDTAKPAEPSAATAPSH